MAAMAAGRSIAVTILLYYLCNLHGISCLLFPRDSPTRASKSLDGVWSFKLSPKMDQEAGFRESWFTEPLQHLGKQYTEKQTIPTRSFIKFFR